MPALLRPRSLDEAIALLDAHGRVADAVARPVVVAGGTDVYPARTGLEAWGKPFPRTLMDVTGIAGLDGIRDEGARMRIGALVTWTELIEAPLPGWFRGLKLAAREVGGVQVQNRGTLAGNLCNASPAADGVPALLALDASVEIAGPAGTREVPLASFITGNRRTTLQPNELVTAILVPKRPNGTRATFAKLGARTYLVISIAMVAGAIEATQDGRVARASLVVGACSEVAQRLPALEAALVGRRLDGTLARAATVAHLDGLTPIDDVRGSAGYRRDAALVLVRRVLEELAGGAVEKAA